MVGYDDGFVFRTQDDRFLLKLNVGAEPVFFYEGREGQPALSTFRFRRARLYLSGNAFYRWLEYEAQLTWETPTAALRDLALEITRSTTFRPKIGQFKVPFDREFLTSGFGLQLIERSIASVEFSLQRDIGVQASGRPGDCWEYRFGVFNSSGGNSANVDRELLYVGRVVFSPFGAYPYSQGALDLPERPRLAIGAGFAYLPGLEPGERGTLAGRLGDTGVLGVESDVVQATADVAFKQRRLSLEGGIHFRSIDPQAATTFGRTDATGFYTQTGYFLEPALEVAGRFARVNPDHAESVGANDRQELAVGVTYYAQGHDLKLQLNYSFETTETAAADDDDHIVRAAVVLRM